MNTKHIRTLLGATGLAAAAALAPAMPAVADSEARSCSQMIAGLEARARTMEERLASARAAGKTVTVETSDGEKTVPAEKTGPVENWFGSPPDFKRVRNALALAAKARARGDEQTCVGHANTARAVLDEVEPTPPGASSNG